MRVALAAEQSVAEAMTWDDETLLTVWAELEARAAAMEEARHGR